jgi:hypothetical protein
MIGIPTHVIRRGGTRMGWKISQTAYEAASHHQNTGWTRFGPRIGTESTAARPSYLIFTNDHEPYPAGRTVTVGPISHRRAARRDGPLDKVLRV